MLKLVVYNPFCELFRWGVFVISNYQKKLVLLKMDKLAYTFIWTVVWNIDFKKLFLSIGDPFSPDLTSNTCVFSLENNIW